MSKQCAICGKKPGTGYKISHAHNKSKRRWLPNLQKIRLNINGFCKRLQVCTKCISANKINKA